MSTWGMSMAEAVSLTDEQIAGLLEGYIDRTKFQAKVLLSVVGEALQSSGQQGQDLSLSSLSSMGFGIEGA